MQRKTITVQLSQEQLRSSAMLQAGLSPKAWSMKPGGRVERNRKSALKSGYQKHKSASFY